MKQQDNVSVFSFEQYLASEGCGKKKKCCKKYKKKAVHCKKCPKL